MFQNFKKLFRSDNVKSPSQPDEAEIQLLDEHEEHDGLTNDEYIELAQQLLDIPLEIDQQRQWSRYPFRDAREKILELLEVTGAVTVREPRRPLALIKPLANFDEFIVKWNRLQECEDSFDAFFDNPAFDTDESFAYFLKFALLEIMETRGFLVLQRDSQTGEVWGYFAYDE